MQSWEYLGPRENMQPAILVKDNTFLLQAWDVLSHIPHSQAGAGVLGLSFQIKPSLDLTVSSRVSWD